MRDMDMETIPDFFFPEQDYYQFLLAKGKCCVIQPTTKLTPYRLHQFLLCSGLIPAPDDEFFLINPTWWVATSFQVMSLANIPPHIWSQSISGHDAKTWWMTNTPSKDPRTVDCQVMYMKRAKHDLKEFNKAYKPYLR